MNRAKPLLSACIIARDEAATLPRCIASLQGLCDEIRVLDTGSRDATIDVAQSLGALVETDTSCNGDDGLIVDFAQARNTCLRLARGSWILQIDADEVLRSGHRALCEVMRRDDADVLGITLSNESTAWVGTRFFRASAARGYIGRVHERLDFQGRYVAARDIVIENHPDKTGKESSPARNLRLLRMGLEENPRDSRSWFYLGNEHRRVHAFDAAIEAYRTCIQVARPGAASAFHSRYYLAVCQFLSDRYHEALQAVDAAIATDSRYAEGHCLRGDIHLMLDDEQAATADYELALRCGAPPADALFAVDPQCYGSYPATRLQRLAAAQPIQGAKTP
ncbi:glycosyltransferase [Dyella sp.]|uniref:glycosyltransferase n=1 Tax=Dyella sp. TaxID=1869338 RepID=UPI002FD93E11